MLHQILDGLQRILFRRLLFDGKYILVLCGRGLESHQTLGQFRIDFSGYFI